MGPLLALAGRLLAGGAARGVAAGAAEGAAGAAARGAASTAGKNTFKRMAFKAGKKILKDKFENALEGSSGESSSGESSSGESASGGTGPKFNIMKNLGMIGAKFNSISSSVGGSELNGNSPATAIRINRNADMTSSLSALNRQMNVMIRVLGSIDSTLKDQLKLQQDQVAGSRETNLENKPGEVVSGGLNSLIGGDGQSGGGGGLMKMVMGFLKGGSVISMLAPLLIPLVAVVAGGLFGVGKSFFKKVGEFFSGDKKDEDATQIPTPDSAVTPNTPVSSPVTTTVPENLKLEKSDPFTGGGMSLGRSFLDEQKSKPMSSGTNTTVTPVQNSSNYMANPWAKPTKTYTAKSGATATPSATPSSTAKPSATPSGSKSKAEGGSNTGKKMSGNSREAYDFFISKGWSKVAAAGIVGNLIQESGFRTSVITGKERGDNKQAYGLAQWHPPRQAVFQQVFKKPITQSDFNDQLEFVHWELNNTYAKAGRMLRNATTPEEAARIGDYEYEQSARKHTRERMIEARKIYGGKFTPPSDYDGSNMGNGGGSGSSGSSGGGDWKSKFASALQHIPLLPGVRKTADAAADVAAKMMKPPKPTPVLNRGNKGTITEGLTFKSTDKATSLVPQPKPKTPTPELRKRRDSAPQTSPLGKNKVSNRDVPNPSASSIIREYQLYFTSRV
jgi:hypothetical protein